MGDGKENRGKSEENEHSGKEGVTRTGDRTFLDTKDREGERNGEGRSDVVRKSEWDHRGARKCGIEPRCFSERTEKVISIGLARGGRGRGTDRKREKEGERRCKERVKDRE